MIILDIINKLSAFSSSSQLSSPKEDPNQLTINKIKSILKKISEGTRLNAEETTFLQNSSPSRFSEWVSQLRNSDEEDVRRIASLRDRILGYSTSKAELCKEVEAELNSTLKTKRKTAHLAALVLNLTQEYPFQELLNGFSQEKQRAPSRGDLIDLVNQYNADTFPNRSLAGRRLMTITADKDNGQKGHFEVKYNSCGYLELTEGHLKPLDGVCRQILTQERRATLTHRYHDLIRELPYNNLGEFLDFMAYFREKKRTQPHLSLRDAYTSYQPNLPNAFNKYRSGRCITLAATFCDELVKQGIEVHKVAHSTLNQWSCLPIAGTEEGDPVPWNRLSQETQGVDHTSAMVFFLDESNHEGLLTFDYLFLPNKTGPLKEYLGNESRSGWQQYRLEHHLIGSDSIPDEIIDSSSISKASLQGRFKLIFKTFDDKILGVDLLRGNLYMNSAWSKLKVGLPLNEHGRVSIDLDALAHPDEIGIYYINSEPTELTHRAALQKILDQAQPEMVVPSGMAEDLITLAQNIPSLFEEFLLEPLPLIRRYHSQLLSIGNRVLEVRRSLWEERPSFIKEGQMLMEHQKIIDAILENNPMELESAIAAFQQKDTQIKEQKRLWLEQQSQSGS